MIKFKNILLVDDDEDYLFLTKHSLENLHVFDKVNTSSSGYEALSFITNNCIEHQPGTCPFVILIDIRMPGMNGFAFLERFMHLEGIVKEDFQIYMVSSYTNDDDKTKLEKYNVRGFINKPLDANKLKNLFN